MGHEVRDADEWDRFYAGDGDDRVDGAGVWSGRPNGTLLAEVTDLPPGTALDVGCGEGADAIWLARRGWRVTALDPSRVALDRARAAADAADVEVTWLHAGLLEIPGGPSVHDLVTAQYPVLRRTPGDEAITALLGAVAPGGTLLVVHHELGSTHASDHAGHADHADHASDHASDHGFDPADHVMPPDVAERLDAGWEVEVLEVRPRPGPVPSGTDHVRDVVLRARHIGAAAAV
jgi:SAM-dependent methyltransferase